MMSDKAPLPPFRTIAAPLDEVDDKALDAVNQRLGVPVLQRQDGHPVPGPVEIEKLTFEVPVYLGQAIRKSAVEQRASVRHIVMLALRGAGFEIRDGDMVTDGRRRRRPM